MSTLPKVSEYQDQMSTDSSNKVGIEELESRQAFNSIVDILNAAWQDWTPTLTWTGTVPLGVTTVAKYTQVGATVYFKFQSARAATTNLITNSVLTISLPVDPEHDATVPPIAGLQLKYTSASYTDPGAYIDMTATGPGVTTHLVKFRSLDPMIGGSTAYGMYLNGFYQVNQ